MNTLMRPVGTTRCAATTLDAFLAERGVTTAHEIKLDTQGFELAILRGAETALRGCQFIQIEVEFNALYEGQPLFSDVDRFLRERGFVLWRLGNLAHYATEAIEPTGMLIGSDPGIQQNVPVANGQLFWADAFYVRKEATAVEDGALSQDAAIAGAALSAQFHFFDLGLEMIRKAGAADLVHELRSAMGLAFVKSAKTHFVAEDFRSSILVCQDNRWVTDFATTNAHIVFGPYVRLPEGRFEAVFNVAASGDVEMPLRSQISFDVSADRIVQNARNLIGINGRDDLARGKIAVPFENGQPTAEFEFRVATFGVPFDGTLAFTGVTLRRLGNLA